MLSSLSETNTQPCNIGTPKICTPLFSAALKIRDLFSGMLSSCHDRKHRHTLVLSIYDIPVLPEKNNKRITFFNHSHVENYTLISFFKAAYCLVVESSMHVLEFSWANPLGTNFYRTTLFYSTCILSRLLCSIATNLPVFGFSKKQGFYSFGSGCASPKTVHS